MAKEIIITNASNQHKFICFNLNGLKDGIVIGIPDKYHNCITVSYKGETKIVPFDAKTEDLEELNSDENIVKPSCLKENKEEDWITNPNAWQPDQVTELDEESFDKFAKEVYDKKVDTEKVEAAKKIFEGINRVDVEIED